MKVNRVYTSGAWISILFCTAMIALFPAGVQAQSYYTNAAGFWNTAANWTNGAAGPGSNLVFMKASVNTNDMANGTSYGWVDFKTANVTNRQLNASDYYYFTGFTNETSRTTLWELNTVFSNTVVAPVIVNLGTSLTLSGVITNNSGAALTVTNTGATTISGALAGASGLTKLGSGTNTLTASNSYLGATTLSAGTLSVGGYANLPTAGGLTFNGGTLQITGTAITNLNPYTVNWGSFSGGLDINDVGNTLTVTNNIVGAGTVTKNGPGALILSNNSVNLNNVLTVTQGSLTLYNVNLTNSAATSDLIGNLAGSTGTLTLEGNSVFARTAAGGSSMEFGKASGSKGVLVIKDTASLSAGGGRSVNIAANSSTGLVYMYGGSVTNTSLSVGFSGVGAMYQTNGVINGNTKIDVGSGSSAYGYYQLSGGTSSNTVKSFLGGPAGSIGIQYQSGGSSYWVDERIGYSGGSTSVLYLTGGTYAFSGNHIRMNNEGGKSVAQLTVAGTAFLNGGSSVGINMNNGIWAGCGSGTDIVNLLGGTSQVSQVFKAVGEGLAILNFHGGTLRAGVTGNLFGTGTNAPDAIYVYDGGAKIDSSTFIITNASPLLAPGGNGISSISGLGGTNFIGAPYVTISGGGGIGATAVSQFDYISGTVTGIVVTSPGVGYSGTPTVTLLGGGGTVTGSASIVTAANISGGLTALGSGTNTFTGTNTYTGATTVNGGRLRVGVATVPGVGGPLGLNSAVNMGNIANAVLDVNGFNTQIGSLSGGGATGGNVILGSATLTVGDNSSPASYAGVISGAGGSLVKIGSGTLTLSGANTYSGSTTISNGVVIVGNHQALSSNLVTLAGGSLTASNGSWAITNKINLANNTTHDITAGASLELVGAITNTGSLIKIGSGALKLSGANTYSGGTTISNGTFRLGAVAAATNAGAVTVAGGLYDLGGRTATNGAITMSSGVISNGTLVGASYAFAGGSAYANLAGIGALTNTAGTTILYGTNTYSGATVIQAGSLILGASASLSNSPVISMAEAATFNVSASGFSLGAGSPQTLACSSTTGVATITAGAGAQKIALVSGSLLSFQAVGGASTTNGRISVNGDLALSGNAITVYVTGSEELAVGTNRLMDCTGTLTGSAAGVPSISPGAALNVNCIANISTSGGHVDLIISASAMPTPSFSGLTASPSIAYGAASVILGGKVNAGGVYPAIGEAVGATINGQTVAGTVTDAAGSFSIIYNDPSLASLTAGVYPITYNYAGNGSTLNAALPNAGTSLTVSKLTPAFSGLSASTNVPYGLTSLSLAGTIGTGSVYPANGETVSATINDHSVNGTVIDSSGNFTITYNDASLATLAGGSYAITYAYAGNVTALNAASDSGRTLSVARATTVTNTVSGNWSGSVWLTPPGPPATNGAADTAIVFCPTVTDSSTNDWSGAFELNRLMVVSNQAVTLASLGGNSLLFTNSSDGAMPAVTNAGSSNLTVNSVITLASDLTLGGVGAITINSNIAETSQSSLIKAGANTLTLSGTNTYSGPTTINAGTLTIGGAGVLGNGTYAAAITNNATFACNSSAAQSLSGNITGAGALTKNGTGALVLSGNTASAGGLTVFQGGLTLNNVTYTNLTTATDTIGNLAGATGTLTLQGNSFFTRTNTTAYAMALGNTSGSKGILLIQDSATVSLSGRAINVGNGGTGLVYMYGGSVTNATIAVGFSGIGALYQTNGVINGNMKIDVGGAIYGYYELSGGTSSNIVKSFLAGGTGSIGVQYQSGGSSYWGDYRLGYSGGSTSVLYLTGGTYAFSGNHIRMNNEGGKSVAELTVAGTAFLNGGSSVGINMNNGTLADCGSGTDIVNLLGGTAQVSQVYKAVGEGLAILNFNGGTLRAGKTGDLFGTGTNAPDAIYIYDGGAKIDSATFTITNASPLLSPSGAGITSITGLGGTNFIGAPYVAISGGGGMGATAVSQFDYISGTVTGIVVTSPGVGYSGQPTVALLGGGGTVTGSAVIVTAANISGGLVKLGSGALLLATNNTYSGDTTNNAGTLKLGHQNALQDSTLVMTDGGTNVFDSAGGSVFTLGGLAAVGAGAGYNIVLTNSAGSAVALTVGGNNRNTIYAGVLSGGGSLIKSGTGRLSLSGTNTYSGATTIHDGTLQISGAGQLGSGTYLGAITNNATLVWASSADQTLSGDMAGTGSLIKTNSGTLTLAGAKTYSGDTTVLQGTLDAVSLGASTVIAVSNSATLIIRSDSTIASDAMVSLDLSAQMNLSNTGTNTVYSLTIGGVPQCRGVWGASGSGAHFTCSQFVTGHNGMLRVVNGPDQGTVYKIR